MVIWTAAPGYPSFLRIRPSLILTIANFAVFLLTIAMGEEAYLLLGQTGYLVFEQHFYWQLFTSMFVHFGPMHLISNTYGLIYFGPLNEAVYGYRRFLAIYLGSGLLGNIISLILLPLTTISGGASGAIFGLVGSYVAHSRKLQHMGGALLYAVLIFVSSIGFGVNIFAHLFGLIGGFIFATYFLRQAKPAVLEETRPAPSPRYYGPPMVGGEELIRGQVVKVFSPETALVAPKGERFFLLLTEKRLIFLRLTRELMDLLKAQRYEELSSMLLQEGTLSIDLRHVESVEERSRWGVKHFILRYSSDHASIELAVHGEVEMGASPLGLGGWARLIEQAMVKARWYQGLSF